MNLQFNFHNISENTKTEIIKYAQKRFTRLDRHLSGYPEDNQILIVNIEYFEKHHAFKAKCTLHFGGNIIHHEEAKHLFTETIDLAESNLVKQIKKSKARYDKKDKFKEVGYIEDEDAPVVTYDNI